MSSEGDQPEKEPVQDTEASPIEDDDEPDEWYAQVNTSKSKLNLQG
jgi:hypothetical protein